MISKNFLREQSNYCRTHILCKNANLWINYTMLHMITFQISPGHNFVSLIFSPSCWQQNILDDSIYSWDQLARRETWTLCLFAKHEGCMQGYLYCTTKDEQPPRCRITCSAPHWICASTLTSVHVFVFLIIVCRNCPWSPGKICWYWHHGYFILYVTLHFVMLSHISPLATSAPITILVHASLHPWAKRELSLNFLSLLNDTTK